MFETLLNSVTDAPILLLGALLFAGMVGATLFGHALRKRHDHVSTLPTDKLEGQESYIVSAVLGLLALLLGFTLSIALDRFDARRGLVLQEANAIGTTYLRVQLLAEPHRARLSKLLVEYTDNRIALAKAQPAEAAKLVAYNDRLLTDIWAATAAAFDSVANIDYSSSLLETTNAMIDIDAARRAARAAHVPTEVLVLLVVYLLITAGVLGYVLVGSRGRLAAGLLLVLLTSSLLLIIDIDVPTMGGVQESQGPMEALRATLKSQPPEVFDRWREKR